MSTKKSRMYERIREHGEQLLVIFPHAQKQDPVELCKALRRIETAASRWAADVRNGVIDPDEKDREAFLKKILKRVEKLLGSVEGVVCDTDPRGYALKIDSSVVRERNLFLYQDFGGSGILAPNLFED